MSVTFKTFYDEIFMKVMGEFLGIGTSNLESKNSTTEAQSERLFSDEEIKNEAFNLLSDVVQISSTDEQESASTAALTFDEAEADTAEETNEFLSAPEQDTSSNVSVDAEIDSAEQIENVSAKIASKESEISQLQAEIDKTKSNIQEREITLVSLTKQLTQAKEDKEKAEAKYEKEMEEYSEKIEQAQKDARSAYESQEVEEGQQPKNYIDFYNDLAGGLKMPQLDVSSYETLISATMAIINSYQSALTSEQDKLTSLNTQVASAQTELTSLNAQMVSLQQAQVVNAAQTQETETSDNVQQTNEVSNVNQAANNAVNAMAASSNERKVITTDVPPVIEGNVVTFGNGRTVKITDGATAKLSDDGKSVIITKLTENLQSYSKECKVANKFYDYSRITYDINGNEVEKFYSDNVITNPKQGNKLSQGGIHYTKNEYDEYGNITKSYYKKTNNAVLFKYLNGEYDRNHREVQALLVPKTMTVYEYDDSGRISEAKNYDIQKLKGTTDEYTPVKLNDVTTYEYIDSENTVRTIKRPADIRGNLKDSVIIKEVQRDDKGRIIKQTKASYTAWVQETRSYVMNSNSVCETSLWAGGNAKAQEVAYIYEYEYDENDNVVCETLKMPRTTINYSDSEAMGGISTRLAGIAYVDNETTRKFLEDKSVLVYKIEYDGNGHVKEKEDHYVDFNFELNGYGSLT